MKKLFLLGLVGLFGLVGQQTQAQSTNQPPSSPMGFISQVGEWASSVNTNLDTFTTDRVDLWGGMDYQQGVNVSASLGLQVPVYKHWITLESVTRNANVAGTVLSEQAGLGLSFSKNDLRFSLFLDGGYRFDQQRPFGAIALQAQKAMTEYTFVGVRVENDFISSKPNTPVFTVFTGFTF